MVSLMKLVEAWGTKRRILTTSKCVCVFSHTKSADTRIFLCLLVRGRDCLNILIRRCFFPRPHLFTCCSFYPVTWHDMSIKLRSRSLWPATYSSTLSGWNPRLPGLTKRKVKRTINSRLALRFFWIKTLGWLTIQGLYSFYDVEDSFHGISTWNKPLCHFANVF